MEHRTIIIYDGLQNSVFCSQVLQPLRIWLRAHSKRTATLISFEHPFPTQSYVNHLGKEVPQLQIRLYRRLPYFGCLTLWYAAWRIAHQIYTYPTTQVIARGPLAGYACLIARRWRQMRSLTIQVRGLLAEEYTYLTCGTKKSRTPFLCLLRAYLFKKVESHVYAHHSFPVTIQAVSPALAEHLVTTYHTPRTLITIAHEDVPTLMNPHERTYWRTQKRTALALTTTQFVYCYNGSAHAWQCPELTVSWFAKQYQTQPNVFLLIVTREPEPFQRWCAQYGLAPHCYTIVSCAHREVNQYLAAADAGIIFREKHILNWVSRPTKVLEYATVGLMVIHNNTVRWIIDTHGMNAHWPVPG